MSNDSCITGADRGDAAPGSGRQHRRVSPDPLPPALVEALADAWAELLLARLEKKACQESPRRYITAM